MASPRIDSTWLTPRSGEPRDLDVKIAVARELDRRALLGLANGEHTSKPAYDIARILLPDGRFIDSEGGGEWDGAVAAGEGVWPRLGLGQGSPSTTSSGRACASSVAVGRIFFNTRCGVGALSF